MFKNIKRALIFYELKFKKSVKTSKKVIEQFIISHPLRKLSNA